MHGLAKDTVKLFSDGDSVYAFDSCNHVGLIGKTIHFSQYRTTNISQ